MIHVLDGLAPHPGRLREVAQRVHEIYEPLVRPFDMRLVHTWMAPAVELRERPTELLIVWELADLPAFWKMRLRGATDPGIVGFWNDLEPLLAGRTRRIMCDPDDPEVLR